MRNSHCVQIQMESQQTDLGVLLATQTPHALMALMQAPCQEDVHLMVFEKQVRHVPNVIINLCKRPSES